MRWAAFAGVVIAVASAGAAWAEDEAPTAPPLTVRLRNTTDIWRNLSGGVRVGYTTLDKLQLNATVDGDALGHPGFKAHLAVFKTNGETLSGSRTGDIQTASNIEALSVTRLFELWAEQGFGDQGAVRAGLLDLNATFDSIDPAGLFLNSSHGIGPDLSGSGLAGPSIFPVSSMGVQLAWTPRKDFALNAAVLDGVPGDPAHPKAFATVRLSRQDGALVIGQADYRLGADAQVSLGAWTYTARLPSVAAPATTLQPRPGVYAFVEGPVPVLAGLRGWLRAGVADGRVQTVSAYLGGGLTWKGLLPGRRDDQLGVAVAHAVIGGPARRSQLLPAAETSVEATYSLKLNKILSLQPDVQYIVHPSGAAHLPDALAVGLRIVAELNRSGR